MNRPSALRSGLMTVTAAVCLAGAFHAANANVSLELETPAMASRLGLERSLVDIAAIGKRLVVVGRMGGIYVSNDAGLSWTQAEVPVSVDLTAVRFVSADVGWAVGHDGVVLRTDDGGTSWKLVLDGRRASKIMQTFYRERVAAGDEAAQPELDEVERFVEEDGARPFLDVWFDNAQDGFIVGAWGLILRTQDGGRTWQPWMHRTDNPDMQHLNAIRRIGGRLWIVGERGLMLRLDDNSGRFVAQASPNTGTWFGIVGTDSQIIAYGLQGRAFVSSDAGSTWQPVNLPTQGVIAAGDLQGGVAVLGDSTGKLWLSRDGARHFELVEDGRATPIFGLRLLDQNRVALIGMAGFSYQSLPAVR